MLEAGLSRTEGVLVVELGGAKSTLVVELGSAESTLGMSDDDSRNDLRADAFEGLRGGPK